MLSLDSEGSLISNRLILLAFPFIEYLKYFPLSSTQVDQTTISPRENALKRPFPY